MSSPRSEQETFSVNRVRQTDNFALLPMRSAQRATQVSFDVLEMLRDNNVTICASTMCSNAPATFCAGSNEPTFPIPTFDCLNDSSFVSVFIETCLASNHSGLPANEIITRYCKMQSRTNSTNSALPNLLGRATSSHSRTAASVVWRRGKRVLATSNAD